MLPGSIYFAMGHSLGIECDCLVAVVSGVCDRPPSRGGGYILGMQREFGDGFPGVLVVISWGHLGL